MVEALVLCLFCLAPFGPLQRTPVHFAALHGHTAVVRLFLNHGIDVNAADAEVSGDNSRWMDR